MLILHDDAYYESRKPQPDLGPFKNFKRSVWNPEKKSFLDRTCEGWAQIGLFYIIFFGVIFALFTFKMWITLQYIYFMDKPYVFVSRNVETLFDGSSRMPLLARSFNDGPGLSFKPNVLTPMTSPIIWLSNTNSKAQPMKYVKALNEFFERFTEKKLPHTTECKDDNTRNAVDMKKPCFFNISILGHCSKPPYGYTAAEPCVIIAFNKMSHWVPKHYNATSDLPSDMPDWLKKLVRQSTKPNIWFSCSGANQIDREHLGEILYIPSPGFPVVYFPYTGNKYHMSPLIAVQFKNVTVNRLLTVECMAWARNINVRNGNAVDFQIMIGKFLLGEKNADKKKCWIYFLRYLLPCYTGEGTAKYFDLHIQADIPNMRQSYNLAYDSLTLRITILILIR